MNTLREEMADTLAENSRTRWIAANAASSYANKVPLSEMETEELECLASVINAELQDRKRRNAKDSYFKTLMKALS